MRKPWNLPSYPVYSLMTQSNQWGKNMNIMTYVTPVSMQPKHYIIAVYRDTQSLTNWQADHSGILQILAPEHVSLVRVLGKKSGKSYDKMQYLSKKWVLSDDGPLSGIAWYHQLEEVSSLPDWGGDHVLYLCRVISSRSYSEDVLMTGKLVEEGVIL